jgi:hypothetical protein
MIPTSLGGARSKREMVAAVMSGSMRVALRTAEKARQAVTGRAVALRSNSPLPLRHQKSTRRK